jgi:hypothetical protein
MVADCTYLPGLDRPRASSRSFAVPVIGFVHGLCARPHSRRAAASARSAIAAGGEGRNVDRVRATEYHERLPRVIDYAAATFIVMAVALAPLAWLITG